MIQLRRNLLPVSSSLTIFAPPSSARRVFCSSMAKLQGRMLHNCTDVTYLSPFGYGDQLRKCSHLKLRKPSTIWTNHLKVGRRNFSLFSEGSSSSRFDSTVRLGGIFNFSSTPVNIYNYCAIRYCYSPNYGARFFSKAPRVMNKNDNGSVKKGLSGGNTLPHKHENLWGRAKILAAQSREAASDARTSASKGQDTTTSSDQLVKGGKKDAKPVKQTSKKVATSSKGASQAKKATATKNGKSEQAPKGKTEPASASEVKKSNITKTGKSSQASENNSTLEEVLNGSASLKCQSNNKTNKTKKSVQESNGSLQKEKPQKKGKTKPSTASQAKKSNIVKSVKESDELLHKQKPEEKGKTKPRRQRTLEPLYPPTGRSVMVVESPAKAKVIQGYLGDQFEVLPSHGHIRDLAARSGSVRTDDNFTMVWEVPSSAWTHLKSIEMALKRAENLILASDPDREGEAIAWHIIEMLQQQFALREDITVARVVFHEITEASIKNALQAPREVDVNLVHAYLARRALDYLIGFNVSPLLWRKLPGCRSAGRVQSAALSLLCDREDEIDEFKPQEYWTVGVELKQKELGSSIFPSRLTHFCSEKLNQFSICSHTEAVKIEQEINSTNFQVVNSKRSQKQKNPPAPFITSTLQQDAANKLHFSATHTMKLAQKLYEGVQLSESKAAGLITYTRTDGLHISDEAVKDICLFVAERYGPNFAAKVARKYVKKVKNAQEAHEAIRPTDIRRLPSMLTGILDKDSLKLYTLIWARTVACQMEPVSIDQIQLDVGNSSNSITFRSTSSKVGFVGYQAVYKDVEAEAIGYKENEENDRVEAFEILNSLKPEDPLHISSVELKQHYTQPPPRYSEGTLVKKLEELGIGRPSTYAATMKVLQDRKYVRVESRVLHPEFRGRMVSAFLSDHFSEVSDYSFTADMETELDNVSAGLTEWKGLLNDYWTRFNSYCVRAAGVHIHKVEKMLEKKFDHFLFSSLPNKNRECPSCTDGTLIFKLSRYGAGYFIGCDQHPRCRYIAKRIDEDPDYETEDDTKLHNKAIEEPILLGLKPNSNEKVLLKNGPYGPYIQLGEDRKGFTPKRVSIIKTKDVSKFTLEDALELLSYPKTIGSHPIDGQPVILKIGKGGFGVKHRGKASPVPKNLDPKDVTLEKALQLLSGNKVTQVGRVATEEKLKRSMETI